MAQGVKVQYVQFYTQGSAAKRVAPAIPLHTGAIPQTKKKKLLHVFIDPVAIMGIVVALSMLVMMLVGVSALRTEQAKTAQLAAQVEQLQAENTALQAQYDEQLDLEKIEQTALALGMIPQQEATHISIEIEPPVVEEQITLWQRIGTFLTGLFA